MTRALAVLLLAGSLVPLAAWIPGGETDPGYRDRLLDWALGLALVAAVGVLVAYVSRKRVGAARVSTAAPAAPSSRDRQIAAALAVGAGLLYGAIALGVFSGRPLLIDEVVHVLQARDLASGALTHRLPQPSEFFVILHEVEVGDRAFGQYPVGGPAVFVPGVWLGATWVIGPAFGAVCVWLFWLLLGHTDPLASAGWRRAATGLFALAPFGAFLFGSHMNHGPALAFLLAAAVCLARSTRIDAPPAWGLAVGLALGAAATIRPLDAVAFALPAALWLGLRARHSPRAFAAFALSGLGVALPVAALLWTNARTTGQPLRFGYDLLWGAGHALGFHEAAWGSVHTPQRGVELIGLYFTRLNTYLFETPFPALLIPATGLWLARALRPLDRYLLAAAGLVVVGYWAYWHDGFFLGPRFLLPLLPVLVLWSARAVPLLRDALGSGSPAWRGVRGALTVGALYAGITVVTVRVPTYRNGLQSMRIDPDVAAGAAGAERALILVQESWGAQLVVRMWAVGVPRGDAERIYRGIDACQLELALTQLEEGRVRGEAAVAQLLPLLADSARLVPRPGSVDRTQLLLPGAAYPAPCLRRVADDERGFALYTPWRLGTGDYVAARWLPGREREMAALAPGRPIFRVRRAGGAPDAPLVWERVHFRNP